MTDLVCKKHHIGTVLETGFGCIIIFELKKLCFLLCSLTFLLECSSEILPDFFFFFFGGAVPFCPEGTSPPPPPASFAYENLRIRPFTFIGIHYSISVYV